MNPTGDPPPTLHLIDSTLAGKLGHHYEYACAVVDEWTSRGLSAAVYCHRDAASDVAARLGARKTFSVDTHARYRPFPGLEPLNAAASLLIGNVRHCRELLAIDRPALRRGDLILVHTINPNQLFGLLLWYRRLARDRRPSLVVVLRYGPGDNPSYRRLQTILYRLFLRLSPPPGAGGLTVASDSDILAREFGSLSGRRVPVLPIPHLPDPPAGLADAPADEALFAFVGNARAEKGFLLLPEAIGGILRRRRDARFVIQSNLPGDAPREMREAAGRLRSLGARVAVVDKVLDTAEYYGILGKADAVLIPYCPTIYRGRTSGIFAEALAFGKAVIVTKGTWMDRQAAELGDCGVAVEGPDAKGLETAMETFLDNRERFRAGARNAASRWRAFHNPRTYVDMLLSIGSPADSPAGSPGGAA